LPAPLMPTIETTFILYLWGFIIREHRANNNGADCMVKARRTGCGMF
jgi:hypothetical protein